MALGQHLRLGYMESLAGSVRRAASESTPRPRTPSKVTPRHGSKGSPPERGSIRPVPAVPLAGKLAEEEAEPRLDWTHQPHRQVLTEGHAKCMVQTPAGEVGDRQHHPHLMRTMRIEPGTPCSKPPVIPGPSAAGQRGPEQITVTEKDLRRCGGNLKLLRECHQRISLQQEQESQRNELAISFKMAFAKRCRSDVDLRDPWKDMKNPEETREKRESDLILNQVWVMTPPKKLSYDVSAAAKDNESPPSARRSFSGSTRASSVDLPSSGRGLGVREGRRSVRRDSRSSALSRQSTFEGTARSESRSRPSSGTKPRVRGDRPEPGPRVPAAPEARKDSKVKNRIQPLESPRSEVDLEEDDSIGSILVREATRQQRHFTQKIDESRHCGSGHCAWMALDRRTGEVELYSKEAALRVEAAFRHGRTSVPLAGVGGPYEGVIVQLSGSDEESKPLERTWDGDLRDVRRLEVLSFMTDAVVQVHRQEGEWRFAEEAVPGVTEDRWVRLSRNEVVTAPSPTLPPVNPDRRPQCFLNPGADWVV